jgi:hypothetical protein
MKFTPYVANIYGGLLCIAVGYSFWRRYETHFQYFIFNYLSQFISVMKLEIMGCVVRC